MQETFLPLVYAFGISLFVCLIGYIRTVWFVSIAYTLSIAILCVTALFILFETSELYNVLQISLLGFWAIRLGTFLVQREYNKNYVKAVKAQTDSSQQQAIYVKFFIWLSVALLYAMMFSPVLFTYQSPVLSSGYALIVPYTGVFIMLIGIVIEALSDYQKSMFKRKQAQSFCNVGLYKHLRSPNYFGEILVWTGNLIVSLIFLHTWWQYLMVFTAWVCIVLIMMGSTKRLERTQEEHYGHDPKFKEYIKEVRVLFPLLPIYSLKQVKVYLE